MDFIITNIPDSLGTYGAICKDCGIYLQVLLKDATDLLGPFLCIDCKAKYEQVFTAKCNECGRVEKISYEDWEGMDRYDVFDHFLCIACKDDLPF